MIAQPHYGDDEILDLLDAGIEEDAHLAGCETCRDAFDEYRAVTSCIGEKSVWDRRVLNEAPVPQTIANLRAFADRMQREDAEAVPLVAELLAGSREEWMPRLQSNPKYRTAGVVRKLMEASDKAIDVMPPDALAISGLSTEIADQLEPADYPSDTVMKLRGNAWRDRAYCLYRCSFFKESAGAVNTAASLLRSVPLAEFDLARVSIVAALVARSFDRLEDASNAARQSAATFRSFGAEDRVASALIASAQARWKSGNTRQALNELLGALDNLSETSEDTQSRLLANVALFYRELGEEESSLRYFELSRFASEPSAKSATELIIQWGIAVLLGRSGRFVDAERRLLELINQFEALEMRAEAAQVGLELAEFYLDDGEFARVEFLCMKALSFYSAAGVERIERARSAVAFLLEATRERRATSETARQVRRFLGRLAVEPALLFVPPPL
ncbi:MAG: hypothetical protein QOE68_4134 [Thermoanaerobaculia bacterium]|jgi:tetratricopeptide (TPR) repeat protein|nr:hypothetical protein [Thermoanaerobaculia bacterium]